MSNKIILSICIPTYNRAKFLPDTLDSIINQIDESNKDMVEICISDNDSQDNTAEIITAYQQKSPIPIIYHKNEKNMWADFNYIQAIKIAHGEYCRWLGSDDIIEKWGIDIILETIQNFSKNSPKIGWLIVNHYAYTFSFKNRIRQIPEVAYWKYKKALLIKDTNTFLDFFDYLWYLSGMVVNKNDFIKIINDEWKNIENWFNAYVHIYILTKIFLLGNPFMWVPQKIVWRRSGNDSFLDPNPQWVVKRMYIDIHWYKAIASHLFSKKETNKILTKISTVHVRAAVLWIKFSSLDYKFKIKTYISILKEYYHLPMFWIKTLPFILCPSFILRVIQKIWRK